MIGNFFVAPAADIKVIYHFHHLCRRWFNFKRHRFGICDNIAVRDGTDPFSIALPSFDDRFDLFACVGNRHFIYQETELYRRPVVIGRVVNIIPDGNDAHALITQILQFHQPAAVAAGKAGEIFHNKNVILMAHEHGPHRLITLPLLKGITGAVAVFVKRQCALREFPADKICNNRLLVLYGSVVAV